MAGQVAPSCINGICSYCGIFAVNCEHKDLFPIEQLTGLRHGGEIATVIDQNNGSIVDSSKGFSYMPLESTKLNVVQKTKEEAEDERKQALIGIMLRYIDDPKEKGICVSMLMKKNFMELMEIKENGVGIWIEQEKERIKEKSNEGLKKLESRQDQLESKLDKILDLLQNRGK